MYVQFLSYFILAGLLFWVLWKLFGKRIVKQSIPPHELRDQLEKEIAELVEAKEKLEILSTTKNVRKELSGITSKIRKLEKELKKMGGPAEKDSGLILEEEAEEDTQADDPRPLSQEVPENQGHPDLPTDPKPEVDPGPRKVKSSEGDPPSGSNLDTGW